VWATVQAERLNGMTRLAEILASTGQLADGVGADEARDVRWACTSPRLYEMLVLERGWSLERFGRFVERSLVAILLATDEPAAPATS
jgi:hypothetical protein